MIKNTSEKNEMNHFLTTNRIKYILFFFISDFISVIKIYLNKHYEYTMHISVFIRSTFRVNYSVYYAFNII
jgi:hypothetical protein